MATQRKQPTAAECAQRLLGALGKGSDHDVRQALDDIVNLSTCATRDAREMELRDLLEAIAAPIDPRVPEYPPAISVQMLAHVASDGRSARMIV